MNDEIGTLLTEEEVAEYLRVTKDALKLWRKEDRGPQYIRVEGAIRYPSRFLTNYLIGRAFPQPQDELVEVGHHAESGVVFFAPKSKTL